MAIDQKGIRADKVGEMAQTKSALNRRSGDKFQVLSEAVFDLAQSEAFDAAATVSTDASGELQADVSSIIDDLVYARFQSRGATARIMHWEPHLTDVTLTHGAVTSGPFQKGETVTDVGGSGGTSTVTAVGTGFVQVAATAGGPFEVGGVLTGTTSSATATMTGLSATVGSTAERAQQRFAHASVFDAGTGAAVASTSIDFSYEAEGTKPAA